MEHLVRLEEEGWRHGQTQGLRGFKVEHQLEPGGLLHGQVSRLGTFEDLVYKDRDTLLTPTGVRLFWSVGHEPSRLGEASVIVNRRQPML